MIGPMRGDISMAPMITAVELVLRPSDAMNMANIRTQRFVPRIIIPLWILELTSSCDAASAPNANLSSTLCLRNSVTLFLSIL